MCALCICSVKEGYGQTFNSGSTGVDGPLTLTTPGTYTFDPVVMGLRPAIENVFHFTTITIGDRVTVRLTSKALTGPVYWLAQGAVTITGTIDASGDPGTSTINIADRVPAVGGAGGYSGGVGELGSLARTPGNGPGGRAGAGVFSGSQYLIPLTGGSGGGGQEQVGCGGPSTPGGGGGGGAILIASSSTITLNNTRSTTINARGGDGGLRCGPGFGYGGSGGAVRLIAPAITLPNFGAAIDVRGGTGQGGNGIVRLETLNLGFPSSGVVAGLLITSAPFMVIPPVTPPSAITVTGLVVNGVTNPINVNPFSFPDATINASGSVQVNVQAQFIPLGTVPKVIVMSESGPDQSVPCSSPLSGTFQLSTCTASITFPTGGSRGFVKATWQ